MAVELKKTNTKKEIQNSCLWIACVNNLWLATGLVAFPILFPTTAIDKGMSGFGTGMLMIIPAVSAALATPYIGFPLFFFEGWDAE